MGWFKRAYLRVFKGYDQMDYLNFKMVEIMLWPRSIERVCDVIRLPGNKYLIKKKKGAQIANKA